MDRSERLRRRNERDRQRIAQETDEQREARSVLLKKLPELQLLIRIHYPPLLFVSLLLIAAETRALLLIS